MPDVDKFPGHIACSSLSRSEIVVPMIAAGEVRGVLDIDSDQLATFDETDREYLEKVVDLLVKTLYQPHKSADSTSGCNPKTVSLQGF